jgi:hypothetical protein
MPGRVVVELEEAADPKVLPAKARPAFSRPGAHPRFYLVEGEPAVLAALPGVRSAVPELTAPPDAEAVAAPAAGGMRALHDGGARGQGVHVALIGDDEAPDAARQAAGALRALAPEAHLEPQVTGRCLGDAIDRAAAELGLGDVLVVPHRVESPAAMVAAGDAATRGVIVVATGGGGPGFRMLVARHAVELAARAACLESYAVAVGGVRLPPEDLAHVLAARDPLAAVDLVAAARPHAHPRPRGEVVLESARILRGGDPVGSAAEIYFEGWVDDGAGGRRRFRIPHAGSIPGVRDGQRIALDAQVYVGERPLGASLHLHVEAWDEDLGRDSLLNPDDLLGVYDRRFTAAERWGEGRHESQRAATDVGAWELSFVVRLHR